MLQGKEPLESWVWRGNLTTVDNPQFGVEAGTTVDFALENGIAPFDLVDDLPRIEPDLILLKRRLQDNGNPVEFPDTSIFNLDWEDWKVWGS